MKQNDIITVNGQAYDTVTGLPVETPKIAPKKPKPAPRQTAPALHTASTQRSKTLRRPSQASAGQKKAATTQPQPTAPSVQLHKPTKRVLDIARHPKAQRFAERPAKVAQKTQDIAPRSHPHVVKAERKIAAKKQAPQKPAAVSSKQIKDAEIAKALKNATPNKQVPKQSRHKKRRTRNAIIAASIIVFIVVLIWLNLPTLSLKFASLQSGVDASFPHFVPDNYTLVLPVKSSDNQVTLNFASHQNDTTFSLSQEKSSWDSQAVRLFVEKESGGQFLTTQDRGVTVYTYGGNAAWVNKGILYKISGDSRLLNETILRIANSL